MELTGKCKKGFEKWYGIYIRKHEKRHLLVKATYLDFFYMLPKSMQYGVYVDFFDSVGEDVDSIYEHEYYLISNRYQNSDNHRLEARTAAIQKANEIYNK